MTFKTLQPPFVSAFRALERRVNERQKRWNDNSKAFVSPPPPQLIESHQTFLWCPSNYALCHLCRMFVVVSVFKSFSLPHRFPTGDCGDDGRTGDTRRGRSEKILLRPDVFIAKFNFEFFISSPSHHKPYWNLICFHFILLGPDEWREVFWCWIVSQFSFLKKHFWTSRLIFEQRG